MIISDEKQNSLNLEKLQIIWLKKEQNYIFAISYIREVLLKDHHETLAINYFLNMKNIILSFAEIRTDNFWKIVGPELLPHLLSYYKFNVRAEVYDSESDSEDDADESSGSESERKEITRFWD